MSFDKALLDRIFHRYLSYCKLQEMRLHKGPQAYVWLTFEAPDGGPFTISGDEDFLRDFLDRLEDRYHPKSLEELELQHEQWKGGR